MKDPRRAPFPLRRLFIDSGKKSPGFARYEGTQFLDVSADGYDHDWADEVYYELPKWNRNRPASPNTLIVLAAAGALAAGRHAAPGAHVEAIPVEWKGSVPKAIMAERLREWMTEAERAVLFTCLAGIPKAKRNDCEDAACMGRWWLAKKGLRP